MSYTETPHLFFGFIESTAYHIHYSLHAYTTAGLLLGTHDNVCPEVELGAVVVLLELVTKNS